MINMSGRRTAWIASITAMAIIAKNVKKLFQMGKRFGIITNTP